MTALVLRCSGRPVGDDLRPTGDPCGRVFKRQETAGWRFLTGEDAAVWVPQPDGDVAYLTEARSAGWSVGPAPEYVAMCPTCRKPSAAVVRDCAAITASVQRAGV